MAGTKGSTGRVVLAGIVSTSAARMILRMQERSTGSGQAGRLYAGGYVKLGVTSS